VVSVRFGPSVTEVEEQAFSNCRSLREVTLNDGLMKIGGNAFTSCKSLKSINLPSTLLEIGRFAFSCCHGLREVVIEHYEKLQTIGQGAFAFCNGRFTFPAISTRLSNVIDDEAFMSFSHLMEDTEVNRIRQRSKIDAILGDFIERRGTELFVELGFGIDRNWNTIKASLDKIASWIKYYEIKEATTLFELALWKAKIDQVDSSNPANREVCRVEVPGPVKDTILQYLG